MRGDTGILAAVAGAPMSVRRRALNRGLLQLPLAARRRAQYLLAHDRPLHLTHPQRWTEKVNWRMVHDRRDIIAMTCDKLATRAWVGRRCDAVTLPRTVWSGDDPTALGHLAWPDSWVLKPNHGTGIVQLGHGRPTAARLAALTRMTSRWLTEPGPELWGEWGYSRARRLIVFEEAVPGTPATGRTDYKFFVAGGEARLVCVDTDRFTSRHRRRFSTPDGRPLDDRTGVPARTRGELPRGWDAAVQAATTLGAAFDAIRVDLYLEDAHPWFGELTAYDGSGLLHFPTPEVDRAMGDTWRLPSEDLRERRRAADPAVRTAGGYRDGQRLEPTAPVRAQEPS